MHKKLRIPLGDSREIMDRQWIGNGFYRGYLEELE